MAVHPLHSDDHARAVSRKTELDELGTSCNRGHGRVAARQQTPTLMAIDACYRKSGSAKLAACRRSHLGVERVEGRE
jgi:hypothetical protein